MNELVGFQQYRRLCVVDDRITLASLLERAVMSRESGPVTVVLSLSA